MVHRCDNCPSVEILKEELMLSNELEMINEISYKQWVKTDGADLKTIITSVDEFIENLDTKLSTLCTHDLFTKLRDAIQSVHWKKEQVTIHPFLAYVKDTANDKLKPIPMCVISDHLVHDTTTFRLSKKMKIDSSLRPFEKKSFFLDLNGFPQEASLIKNLKLLGARHEPVFSRYVSFVISNKVPLKTSPATWNQRPYSPLTPKSNGICPSPQLLSDW
ncbi:hypothetical protein AVEN_107536-1 [Araneus ventricosus]|uniref:Uncharacterized protein n=1 Tax=Araneus ventricosus TaxID=182803 RepID=A0A4Y2VVS7_ARAVE|nr:hypothetical protein AVEN_107536-1 [Araneus ventricosus]